MRRRTFLFRAGGLAISVATGSTIARTDHYDPDRVGLGTVTLRNRFEQTRPKGATIASPLTLLDVPGYYRERFAVRNLELWSNHFESLEPSYLKTLRKRIDDAGAVLVNIQVDADYDLASTDESTRRKSLETARKWIDAAASLRSQGLRLNPGSGKGSVEQSIASLTELNRYCLSKHLLLHTENHFGLEMNPDVHLRIREAAGPQNLYTLPDFGNYPTESMWESLAKILPHARIVSAKAVDFDAQGNHVSYDFERCLQLCESAGFKGTFLVEQWSRKEQPIDAEKIAEWMLERTRRFVRARVS